MIDTFDSRALRRTDCYGQRFMRPGEFRYDVVPASWCPVSTERPFAVEVAERRSEDPPMHQHTVVVRMDGKRFRPEQDRITIEVGDLVVWHCAEATTTPFAVVGEDEFFGNLALVNECGFSHAFSAAGEYPWVDAYGSGVGGVVRVKDPGCTTIEDVRRWQEELARGTLVMITENGADPAEVDITTGQTVYFAVVTGPGVSVTDARLVDAGKDSGCEVAAG